MMKNPLLSTKFLAAVLSSIIMGVLVAVGVDLTTASLIVAPLAAFVPFQAVADLRKPQFEPEELEQLRKFLAMEKGSRGAKGEKGDKGEKGTHG